VIAWYAGWWVTVAGGALVAIGLFLLIHRPGRRMLGLVPGWAGTAVAAIGEAVSLGAAISIGNWMLAAVSAVVLAAILQLASRRARRGPAR
jgi:hypothetical protein